MTDEQIFRSTRDYFEHGQNLYSMSSMERANDSEHSSLWIPTRTRVFTNQDLQPISIRKYTEIMERIKNINLDLEKKVAWVWYFTKRLHSRIRPPMLRGKREWKFPEPRYLEEHDWKMNIQSKKVQDEGDWTDEDEESMKDEVQNLAPFWNHCFSILYGFQHSESVLEYPGEMAFFLCEIFNRLLDALEQDPVILDQWNVHEFALYLIQTIGTWSQRTATCMEEWKAFLLRAVRRIALCNWNQMQRVVHLIKSRPDQGSFLEEYLQLGFEKKDDILSKTEPLFYRGLFTELSKHVLWMDTSEEVVCQMFLLTTMHIRRGWGNPFPAKESIKRILKYQLHRRIVEALAELAHQPSLFQESTMGVYAELVRMGIQVAWYSFSYEQPWYRIGSQRYYQRYQDEESSYAIPDAERVLLRDLSIVQSWKNVFASLWDGWVSKQPLQWDVYKFSLLLFNLFLRMPACVQVLVPVWFKYKSLHLHLFQLLEQETPACSDTSVVSTLWSIYLQLEYDGWLKLGPNMRAKVRLYSENQPIPLYTWSPSQLCEWRNILSLGTRCTKESADAIQRARFRSLSFCSVSYSELPPLFLDVWKTTQLKKQFTHFDRWFEHPFALELAQEFEGCIDWHTVPFNGLYRKSAQIPHFWEHEHKPLVSRSVEQQPSHASTLSSLDSSSLSFSSLSNTQVPILVPPKYQLLDTCTAPTNTSSVTIPTTKQPEKKDQPIDAQQQPSKASRKFKKKAADFPVPKIEERKNRKKVELPVYVPPAALQEQKNPLLLREESDDVKVWTDLKSWTVLTLEEQFNEIFVKRWNLPGVNRTNMFRWWAMRHQSSENYEDRLTVALHTYGSQIHLTVREWMDLLEYLRASQKYRLIWLVMEQLCMQPCTKVQQELWKVWTETVPALLVEPRQLKAQIRVLACTLHWGAQPFPGWPLLGSNKRGLADLWKNYEQWIQERVDWTSLDDLVLVWEYVSHTKVSEKVQRILKYARHLCCPLPSDPNMCLHLDKKTKGMLDKKTRELLSTMMDKNAQIDEKEIVSSKSTGTSFKVPTNLLSPKHQLYVFLIRLGIAEEDDQEELMQIMSNQTQITHAVCVDGWDFTNLLFLECIRSWNQVHTPEAPSHALTRPIGYWSPLERTLRYFRPEQTMIAPSVCSLSVFCSSGSTQQRNYLSLHQRVWFQWSEPSQNQLVQWMTWLSEFKQPLTLQEVANGVVETPDGIHQDWYEFRQVADYFSVNRHARHTPNIELQLIQYYETYFSDVELIEYVSQRYDRIFWMTQIALYARPGHLHLTLPGICDIIRQETAYQMNYDDWVLFFKIMDKVHRALLQEQRQTSDLSQLQTQVEDFIKVVFSWLSMSEGASTSSSVTPTSTSTSSSVTPTSTSSSSVSQLEHWVQVCHASMHVELQPLTIVLRWFLSLLSCYTAIVPPGSKHPHPYLSTFWRDFQPLSRFVEWVNVYKTTPTFFAWMDHGLEEPNMVVGVDSCQSPLNTNSNSSTIESLLTQEESIDLDFFKLTRQESQIILSLLCAALSWSQMGVVQAGCFLLWNKNASKSFYAASVTTLDGIYNFLQQYKQRETRWKTPLGNLYMHSLLYSIVTRSTIVKLQDFQTWIASFLVTQFDERTFRESRDWISESTYTLCINTIIAFMERLLNPSKEDEKVINTTFVPYLATMTNAVSNGNMCLERYLPFEDIRPPLCKLDQRHPFWDSSECLIWLHRYPTAVDSCKSLNTIYPLLVIPHSHTTDFDPSARKDKPLDATSASVLLEETSKTHQQTLTNPDPESSLAGQAKTNRPRPRAMRLPLNDCSSSPSMNKTPSQKSLPTVTPHESLKMSSAPNTDSLSVLEQEKRAAELTSTKTQQRKDLLTLPVSSQEQPHGSATPTSSLVSLFPIPAIQEEPDIPPAHATKGTTTLPSTTVSSTKAQFISLSPRKPANPFSAKAIRANKPRTKLLSVPVPFVQHNQTQPSDIPAPSAIHTEAQTQSPANRTQAPMPPSPLKSELKRKPSMDIPNDQSMKKQKKDSM